MNLKRWKSQFLAANLLAAAALGAEPTAPSAAPASVSPPRAWSRGLSTSPNFFPLAVWLQDPKNAMKYRAAGFNTYVGLWQGPTGEQLDALKKAGMNVICEQNDVALQRLEDKTIVAWMHGDEPDNAQSLGEGSGWGPPVAPERIVADYQRIRQQDPSRPVMLNLGQGVAWDDYYGRGVRTRHSEDYPRYMEGADLVSFDIYPAVHDRAEVAGKLWYVAQGVQRLVGWGKGSKIVWNCLECTRISNLDRKPTPHELRAEAWMSLIHGSRGLIYFVHQFKPVFREAALLDDAEMLAAAARLNREITELAPVLNAGLDVPPGQTDKLVEPHFDKPEAGSQAFSPKLPAVARLIRTWGGGIYCFATEMQGTNAVGVFHLGATTNGVAEVLGENRRIQFTDGTLRDAFKAWDVHLYRIAPNP